ncbi:MAG: ABC transporter substrate-binding protein [Devosia sp.]
MSLKSFLAIAIVGLAAVAATAEAVVAKDELVVNLVNEPASLDPHLQWNPDSYYVYRNIFDNIVTRDDAGEIVPEVAESWKQLSDTELELTIRDGITFHDGEPLTADDVVYSVKRITDPAFASPQLGQFNKISDAIRTGANTVTLVTDGPYPTLLAQLVKLSVVPAHVVEKVGKDAFNAAPIGSGPYMFEKWDRGVGVQLTRNDNYWGTKGVFQTAVFRAVPDAATRVANLQAGTADLVVSLDSDIAQQLDNAAAAKVLSVPTERIGFLNVNSQTPPLNNPDVRRAVALAIDRQGIVDGILAGGERVLNQMATPSHFGYVEGAEAIPYDPETAKELVTAAGVKDTIVFATAPVFDQRIVQAIQQMLIEVGFNVEISMTDMANYLKTSQQPGQENRPMLSFGGWSCACQDVDGVEFPLMHSSSNWARVNDPELDALLEAGRSTLDKEKRMEAYMAVQEIVSANTYLIPLFQAAAIYGAAKGLEWQPTANESLFVNRMNWSN